MRNTKTTKGRPSGLPFLFSIKPAFTFCGLHRPAGVWSIKRSFKAVTCLGAEMWNVDNRGWIICVNRQQIARSQ